MDKSIMIPFQLVQARCLFKTKSFAPLQIFLRAHVGTSQWPEDLSRSYTLRKFSYDTGQWKLKNDVP